MLDIRKRAMLLTLVFNNTKKVKYMLLLLLSCGFFIILLHLHLLELPLFSSMSNSMSNDQWIPDPEPWIPIASPTNLGDKLLNQFHTNWRQEAGGFNFQDASFPTYAPQSKTGKQLAQAFPYDPDSPMPKTIWQTWKVGLDSPEFPKTDRKRIDTWLEKNPGYTHTLFSDDQMLEFVETEFAAIPQVVETFKLLPKPVLKADFFRYLIVFARGGIYSDIDTVNLKPIDSWVSSKSTIYNTTNHPGLIVGLEANVNKRSWTNNFTRLIQFAQWTFQGKPGHPILLDLIAKICEQTITRARNNDLGRVVGKSASDDVMNWTGPGIWSDSILKYLDELFQVEEYVANRDWEDFTLYFNRRRIGDFSNAIVIHDVVLLPLTSFSPGHNGGGSPKEEIAYVQHCYDGSWKNGKLFG